MKIIKNKVLHLPGSPESSLYRQCRFLGFTENKPSFEAITVNQPVAKCDGIRVTDTEKPESLDPIYFTDDYPREGCKVTLFIKKDITVVLIHTPNGSQNESFHIENEILGESLNDWINGGIFKKRKHKLPSEASDITEQQ